MAEAVRALEVLGVPLDMEEELLVLYFENRRRSGGGPVLDCRRQGSRAILTFESPEDAQRVLAKPSHTLQDTRLAVRPAAPQDYGKVLLRGLNPQTEGSVLELYVECVLNCQSGRYTIHRSPAGDQALVQLPEPLSDSELLAVEERVRRRLLDGTPLAVGWVQQTDSVLVWSRGTRLSGDLLELYFENKRSGGGSVQAVRVLAGGRAAVVSFQDRAAVQRVLEKPHRLQESDLDLCPYYDFLEPLDRPPEEGAEAPPGEAAAENGGPPAICVSIEDAAKRQLLESSGALPELQAVFPELMLRLEESGAWISGGDEARRQQLQEQLLDALQGMGQELLPLPAQTLCFLQRGDVREEVERLLGSQACYAPSGSALSVTALSPAAARQATSSLSAALSPFCLPVSAQHLHALGSPRWEQLQASLHCCSLRLAPGGEHLQALTLRGLEQENREKLQGFLQDTALDESLVSMEPGMLRYLQLCYQELLASIAEVTLLPLEGTDVTGFRLSGEAGACRAAAEFLQSLLGTISSQPVTLRHPGIARFLLDKRGQSILRDLERRFQCVIGLEQVHWSPPYTQDLELPKEPIPLSCRRDSLPTTQLPTQLEPPDGATTDWCTTNIEEIKGLLAALEPGEVAGAPQLAAPAAGEAPGSAVSHPKEVAEEDLYTMGELGTAEGQEEAMPAGNGGERRGLADGNEEEEQLHCTTKAAFQPECSVEEEAQLLLAIQQSMDSQHWEEEELQRATELSLRSYEQEQHQASAEPAPDHSLQAALQESLEEALCVAGSAQLIIYSAYEQDVSALPGQLEQALRAQQRQEKVVSEGLRALPSRCRGYLAQLQRQHAVRISLQDTTATVHGFADYTACAARDLARLLPRLLQAQRPLGEPAARWVRWEPPGTATAIPYSSEASALLEQAWRQRQKQLDVLFDDRPFTIDFERMEEYDASSARTLAISRTEPPAPQNGRPTATEEKGPALDLDEAVKLVPLGQGSEEFRDTVRRFYDTLEDFHNKIRIVKVEKLIHPLLYKQYQLKKACMEKVCGHEAVERLLFHGTTEEASREICQHGFNRSFCGKNATLYGHGVYFAVNAVLSVQEQYSPCSADGNKYIFVAKTLTGDYTAGSRDMRAPPLKEAAEAPLRYDSVVDNPKKPAIFVIFNDTQAYPQYLITCQLSKPPAPR
ncbi:protein mono-ADP-ribosyltransferase PARP10 isoform X3 [Dermochelys coriacea]|uniref:protein mono-ADP-ribosyltransferase PARP10 isoform X3 n=1 Tax=Dermochelys coriacea TaxID=27794 RepID=UPI001CA82BC5|nr:protein mono-ADP-ribosyltransferase PARP10 isoform X3 [Dermochelys coriacea]XP_043363148.1 protein mono-ADP-ribosyltransferase PARP10 isoform X3 [Dermochelys coriacea]